jgi:Fe-S oxidoreductase
MIAVTPYLEVADTIVEYGGRDMLVCMQCGTCTGVCPWGLVREFSPRGMIRLAQLGLEGFESDDLWNCVTCNTCVKKCPRGVDIIDIVKSMRAIMTETGSMPASLKVPTGSLHSQGNPWSGDPDQRAKWAEDLDISPFTEDTEYLYFACCTNCYDPRNQKVAQALAKLLKKAGVDFGIIGVNENCCGDAVRKMGGEELYGQLANKNISLFNDNGVKKIIVSSPHCYNTFIKEYPEFGGEYAVIHHAQLLKKLIDDGTLVPTKPIDARVTYHDPCYLGRHNDIYDAPRDVLKAIPGLKLVEMPRCREDSLCCGGGGGGLWMEVPSGERFSELRIEEAVGTGASILAAACPYCISMFEDAVKTTNRSDDIKIMDIAELLAESIE